MRPVVVFNPHPWPLRADVEVEYTWLREEGARVVDDEGEPVPMQLTRPLTTMSSLRGRLVFPVERAAARLPHLPRPQGRRSRASRSPRPTRGSRTSTSLLELDPATGRIAQLVAQGDAAPTSPRRRAQHAVVVDDRSDTWGHGVRAYDEELGEFECVVGAAARDRARCGRSSASRAATARSTLREDYVLGADAPYVDVRVALDWHEQLKLLKLRYPTSVETETATFETPYGHLERPAGRRRGAGPVVGRRLRRRPRAHGAQRREVRLRRARRRHRHQRGAQPGLGLARPARARGGRRLRVHGPGPADLPRAPRPARGRLARRRRRAAARPSSTSRRSR